MTVSDETREWYANYYAKKGADRNDLLTNPEVLFQHLSCERAVVAALRRAGSLDRADARILDVGCGGGGSLARFLTLGFSPSGLHGIDIISDRIEEGRIKYPNMTFTCADATAIPYESGRFDLVLESTMFVQLTDDVLAQRIAAEMLRITKPGGHILLIDWRYSKPGNSSYLGLSTQRIRRLFGVPSAAQEVCALKGALIPPVGRLLSKYLPSIYFLVQAIFPPLTGQTITLLKRSRGA